MANLLWARTKLRSSPVIDVLCWQYKQASSSISIGALRAFYLSVHPDFFAQHPNIQKVNESSLKRLNSYLGAIQCAKQTVNLQPTKVTFYFRKDKNVNDFKKVNFTLRSHDLLTNIEHILTSCDLSVSHLSDMSKGRSRERPLEQRYRKSHGGQAWWGRTESKEDLSTEKSALEVGLRQWLRKNISTINQRQLDSRSVTESNTTIKNAICLNTDIAEIIWCSPWQHSSEQGVLRNFVRMCNQHRENVQYLSGKRLVFTDETLATADRSVCLNVGDVPQQWMQFLANCHSTYTVQYQDANTLDIEISKRFGNIKVIRPKVRMSRFREHNLISINEYLSIVSLIWSKVKPRAPETGFFKPESLSDLEITFSRSQNLCDKNIGVLPNGRLRVMHTCDPVDLMNFISQNKAELQERNNLNASAKNRSQQLMEICREKLHLLSITKDFDVDHEKMTMCCERLLRNATEFALLNGLELRITLDYFSVFDQGQFCIPWDWKI